MNTLTAIPVPEYGETDSARASSRCIDCQQPLRAGERVQCDICNGAVEDLFVYDMQQIIENSDLDWLARNIHEWPGTIKCAAVYACKATWKNALPGSAPTHIARWESSEWFTETDWAARRAELQNKPRWDDHSHEYLVQNADGQWWGMGGTPSPGDASGVWLQTDSEHSQFPIPLKQGEVLGDWRSTLERRPEPIIDGDVGDEQHHVEREFNPTTSSLNDSQQRELSAVTKLCSDGGHCGLGGFCRECPNAGGDSHNLAARYPAYYKSVTHLDVIDVYQVHNLFQLDDPTGCIHHASKKLLLSGNRTGGKPKEKDIKEARDTLTRWLQINGVES